MRSGQVVFWDFDGTLAERDGTWPTILRDAILMADPRQTITVADLAPLLLGGFPNWKPGQLRIYPDAAAWWAAASSTFEDVCCAAGLEPAIVEHALAEVPRIYYHLRHWRTMPGALEALAETANAGLRNVILSNHAPQLPELVRALGFGPLIERTITSASLGAEKPDPAVYREALRLVGGTPDSWMIGDDQVADVEGAQAVGLRAVLVHRPGIDKPARSLLDAADLVIRDLRLSR